MRIAALLRYSKHGVVWLMHGRYGGLAALYFFSDLMTLFSGPLDLHSAQDRPTDRSIPLQ
jgi:hypothetical protein